MTAALIVAGLVAVQGVALLVGARLDVISLHVRRPPRPKTKTEATP